MSHPYHPPPAAIGNTHPSTGPVDPSDGERTPLIDHQNDSARPDVSPVVSQPKDWARRPSFLGFQITGSSQIKQSQESERLFNYVEKASRLKVVRELRPKALIGDVCRLYNWSEGHVDEDQLEKLKNKNLRSYYEKQNGLIEKYQEVDKLLDSGIQQTMLRNYSERNDGSHDSDNDNDHQVSRELALHRRQSAVPGDIDLETGNLLGYNRSDEMYTVSLAIMVNFFANVVLLIGKIVVAILTSSISIIASLLDSALDFLSTLIIYFSNKLSQAKNSKEFPVGRNRLEPLGVLVFSIIIIICFAQVGLEAFERLLHGKSGDIVEIGFTSVMIMILTIVTKLGCFFWCKSVKSSSVEALTQDALVDVVFNSFSILMPVLGYHFSIWWFDPLGALLLSIYIIYLWFMTCAEHIIKLAGRNAEADDYQVVLYLCMRFAEKIDKIKDISCYHVGDSINVEVDLVLDPKLDVKDSHDIAEALQYTIEALPIVNVERAFVHIDYTVGNFKGHLG